MSYSEIGQEMLSFLTVINSQEIELMSFCQLRLYKGALAGGRSNNGG